MEKKKLSLKQKLITGAVITAGAVGLAGLSLNNAKKEAVKKPTNFEYAIMDGYICKKTPSFRLPFLNSKDPNQVFDDMKKWEKNHSFKSPYQDGWNYSPIRDNEKIPFFQKLKVYFKKL